MARRYASGNFPLPAVEELRRLGHDLLTTMEAGHAGLAVSDAEVLAQATAQGRAVLTFNRRHFIRLHAESPRHAGIIVCIFDVDFAALARRIDAAIRAMPALEGKLLRVNRTG
jgi:hypothetical protein